MALSSIVKTKFDGRLVIEDGTAVTPLDITVQYEAGDFSLSGLNQASGTSYDIAQYLDRGEFFAGGVRKTGRTFPTFSFTAYLTELSDGTNETIPDIVLQQNSFSAAVSTLGTNADCYSLNLILTIEGTDHGDSTDNILTLSDCLISLDMAEGDPDTFSLSGTVLGTIAMT